MRTLLICASLLALSIVPLAAATSAQCEPENGAELGVSCTVIVSDRESEAGTFVDSNLRSGAVYYCFDLIPPSHPNIREPCSYMIWN